MTGVFSEVCLECFSTIFPIVSPVNIVFKIQIIVVLRIKKCHKNLSHVYFDT